MDGKEKSDGERPYKYKGKQIVWLIQKNIMEMGREYIWGINSILVGALLVSVLPIYLLVVDMFYLVTSMTLRV